MFAMVIATQPVLVWRFSVFFSWYMLQMALYTALSYHERKISLRGLTVNLQVMRVLFCGPYGQKNMSSPVIKSWGALKSEFPNRVFGAV